MFHYKYVITCKFPVDFGNANLVYFLKILPETLHVKGFIAVIKFTVKHYLKFLKETINIDLGFDLQEFYKDELQVI